jgi:PAS domain S-box-containing protein
MEFAMPDTLWPGNPNDRGLTERDGRFGQQPMRQMLEKLPVAACTCDGDGLITYFNPPAFSLWGRAPKLNDATDRYCGSYKLFSSSGQPLAHDKCWMARALREGKEFNGEEIIIERPDGSRVKSLAHARPLRDESNRIIGAVTLLVDLSDRQRAQNAEMRPSEGAAISEHRFRRLYESAQIAIFFYREDGRLYDPNDEFLNLIGANRADLNRLELNWRRITPPGWEPADEKAWTELRQHGRCQPFEKEFCHRDGHPVPVLMSAATVDAINFHEGVAVVLSLEAMKQSQDSLRLRETELRILNETLERRVRERTEEAEARSHQLRALALDLAETESRERKRLARMLHDHFQQLVSAAKLKAGMVRRAISDPKAIASLEQTERLLEDAIAASRSLATELSPPLLNDAGLVAGLEWLARKIESDSGLRVVLLCDPAAEPASEQVRTLVFECARELLSNVVKHAAVKEATLTLRVIPDGILHLVLTDLGAGFDMQELSVNRHKNETSFGLFSMGERLSFVGGLLNVRSEIGKGTRVEVSVPIGIPHPIQPAAAPSAPVDLRGKLQWVGTLNRPARIMVADDHRLFREAIIYFLSQEPGLLVVGEAADGEAALESARRLKPDILILDVSMPKMNGVKVAAKISRELPHMCIIGLSMHQDRDMAKAMYDAGAAAYLTKDGSSESLLNLLRSVIAPKANPNPAADDSATDAAGSSIVSREIP